MKYLTIAGIIALIPTFILLFILSIMAIYLVIHDLIIPEIHEKLEEREWNKLCH